MDCLFGHSLRVTRIGCYHLSSSSFVKPNFLMVLPDVKRYTRSVLIITGQRGKCHISTLHVSWDRDCQFKAVVSGPDFHSYDLARYV